MRISTQFLSISTARLLNSASHNLCIWDAIEVFVHDLERMNVDGTIYLTDYPSEQLESFATTQFACSGCRVPHTTLSVLNTSSLLCEKDVGVEAVNIVTKRANVLNFVNAQS